MKINDNSHPLSSTDILDQLPGNVYWKNLKGECLGCNKNNAAIFDADPKDLIGLTDYDIMSHDIARKLEKNNKRVIETGEPLIIEEEGIDRYQKPARYLSYKKPLKNNYVRYFEDIYFDRGVSNILQISRKLFNNDCEIFKSQFNFNCSKFGKNLSRPLLCNVSIRSLIQFSHSG